MMSPDFSNSFVQPWRNNFEEINQPTTPQPWRTVQKNCGCKSNQTAGAPAQPAAMSEWLEVLWVQGMASQAG
jgi:hypothetical protein